MSYQGRRILVLGLGRSGRAAATLLLRHGARVCGYDRNPEVARELDPRVERLAELPADFAAFDMVVASPGFPQRPDPKLVPEVDLAAAHIDAPIVGVTGTNGKSTTTVLIGRMLAESGLRTAVGGNLGTALCTLVEQQAERVVCELSSFQLEHARRLRASVAVLLNLSPDHLDRHGSVEAYAAAKERLVALQQPEGVVVANLDDAWARSVAERVGARARGFSSTRRLASGAYSDGKDLVLVRVDGSELRVPLTTLTHACRSPLDNALAAVLAADAAGATPDAIRRVLASFEGLPHRAQLVCVRGGVRWIDDSKATNPAAAAATLRSCGAPLIWLAGGRNKGLDFSVLRDAARDVATLISYGESGEALAKTLPGIREVVRVDTLGEAVAAAAARARPGATVLLAPACSSFDQFRDFEERGEIFARLARALPESTGQESRAC